MPPSLSLPARPRIESVEEFARVARIGLGRAILFLYGHDPAPYREAILDVCLHYTGYDWQIEGTRTSYLCDLLEATGQWRTFVAPIVAALRAMTNFRDADQLVRLAARFAENDYADARAALYEAFEEHDRWEPFGPSSYSEPFLGYSSIIHVDGLDGFLHVADRMGAALLGGQPVSPSIDEGDRWMLTSAHSIAEEDHGEEAVKQALDRASADNPRIRAYVEAVTAEEAENDARRQAVPDLPPFRDLPYEQVKLTIAGEGTIRLIEMNLREWGRRASDGDLAWAAADLLAETDEARLARCLHLFGERPFPPPIDPILALARHSNRQVIVAACNALARIESPQVRAFALEMFADTTLTGWHKSRVVDLLLSNYESGDEAVLLRLLEALRTDEHYHNIGLSALHVLKPRLTLDAVPVLLEVYEHGPCTTCRRRVLEMLHQLGAVPDWLLEECRYDASLDVRERAEKLARSDHPPHD